jgi:hypothetical protein
MLPFYELTINDNDETGVSFNALVDVPAHLKNFVAFGKNKTVKYNFNEEERMVVGVMMSANTFIYRPADEGAPDHNVFFKAETIKQIRKKFHRQQLGTAMNEMHDPNRKVSGVTMIDSYIIGGDKNPTAPEVFKNLNLQDGTWIASYYVENNEVWNKVKSGEFQGFSVEGIFDRSQIDVRKKFNSNMKNKNKKSIWSFVFGAEEQAFAEATTVDGVTVFYEGELAEGTLVQIIVDGEMMPAPAGDHQIMLSETEAVIITLDDTGVITAVEPVVADEEMSADDEFVSAEDFKAFMLKFQSDIDAKLVEANKTIKMQAEKIKQMEAFQTSKFNYQAKEVKTEGGSYKDLLNKKK